MRRFIAFALSVLTVVSLCAFSVGAAEEQGELYASVVNFDNQNSYDEATSKIRSEEATIVSVKETTPAEDPADPDVISYHLELSANVEWTARVDASSLDFSEHHVSYIVIDSFSDLSRLTVKPILKSGEIGETCEFCPYNGTGYFKLKSASDVSGAQITAPADFTLSLTEVFFCENEYSAKFIVDNNVLPSTAQRKKLFITESEEQTVIDLSQTPNDVVYHYFNQSKWPNIAADENDKIYIAATGCKRPSHMDIFDSALMVTSEDGGKTYSQPRRFFNTFHGATPSFLCLGNGRLLASVGTGNLPPYMPGGVDDACFRNYIHGGLCDDLSVADSWDENGYAVGGMMGTYIDVLQYLLDNDPEHTVGHNLFMFSDDYGETWNVDKYVLQGEEGVDYTPEMKQMAEDYELYDTKGLTHAPAYGAHGPKLLSNGEIMIVGNEHYPKRLEDGAIACYATRDEGESWTLKSQVKLPCDYSNGNFQEPDVTETKDGVLLCGLRSFVIFNCFSYDMGMSWTTPVQTEMQGYPPGYITMDNGDIVITTGWRYGSPKIYCYVSEDGGRTWSEKAELSRNFGSGDFYTDMGYPNSVSLSDGTVVTCYYDNRSNIGVTNWTYELAGTKNGWAKNSRGWFYLDEGMNMVRSKWIKDSSGECWLGADGYLATARGVKDPEKKKWYLVDEAGRRITNKTGWQKVGGGWYYLEKDGSLKTDCWMKDSKGWCFLLSNGLMATNRSVTDSKGYCLVDGSGYWVTTAGWKKAGGIWYYVEKGGYLKTGGWMKDSKGWCYLDTDGMMKTSTTVKDTKGWCFIDESGYWVTSKGWKKQGSDWYYVDKGGYLKCGDWMNDSKGWCYLDSNGKMLKDTAVKDTKGWCLLDKDGYWQYAPNDNIYIPASYGGGLPRGYYRINEKGYIVEK